MGITQHQRTAIGMAGAVLGFGGLAGLREDLDGWWENIKDLGGAMKDNPVAACSVLIAIMLVLWAFWPQVRALLGFPQAKWRDHENIKSAIIDWLKDSPYSVTVPAATEVDTQAEWQLHIKDQSGTGVTVTHLKAGTAGVIGLTARVTPGDEHRRLFESHPDSYLDLQDELAIQLARMGVGFQLKLGEKSFEEIPFAMTVSTGDGFGENLFNQSLTNMYRATYIVIVIIRRASRAAGVQAAALGIVEPYQVIEGEFAEKDGG